MSKIKQLLNKVVMNTKKNSPAILTGVGVVGLGATAYLAYKSRHKVEAVVLEIEEARENNAEINKVDVARDIAEAVYLPVAVGVVSVTAIVWSYRIQNNRIAVLASSLAAQQAHNLFMEKKYRKLHGDEAYSKFIMPTETETITTVDEKGKTKLTVNEVKKEVDRTIGQWYDESDEYVSDDHAYNLAMIDSLTEKLELVLFQRGHLLLNEVREILGFERIRNGALLGWSTGDVFNIEKVVTNMLDDESGELKEQIYVSWSRPRYVYEEVEFNGRYSING